MGSPWGHGRVGCAPPIHLSGDDDDEEDEEDDDDDDSDDDDDDNDDDDNDNDNDDETTTEKPTGWSSDLGLAIFWARGHYDQ